MKSHLISAGYQLETYSKYKTANAFAEASKQAENFPSYFIPWSVSRQSKSLHTHT